MKVLVERDDGPWANWWETKLSNGNTKGPGAQLAKLLRPYGINSKPIRLGGEVQKGYRREDFKEAFRRYLPRRPKEVTSVEGKQNEEFPSQNHIQEGNSPSRTARNLVTSSGIQEEGKDNGGPAESDEVKLSLVERVRREIMRGSS